ncbi:MAG: hypothetical protein AB7V16_07090 [Vulcanibacillus sp.]
MNDDEVATKEKVLNRAKKLHTYYSDKKELTCGKLDALLLATEVLSYLTNTPYAKLIEDVND